MGRCRRNRYKWFINRKVDLGYMDVENNCEYFDKNDFKEVLLNNFVPFWEKNSPDSEYGGFLCGFEREAIERF